MKQFAQNEEAVSPVIGVILMVAITVILAAVIAAFVFGMTGNVESTKNVGMMAKLNGTNNIDITVAGGADIKTLVSLNASVNGQAMTKYLNSTASIKTGDIYTMDLSKDFGTGVTLKSPYRVIVTGKFTDGTEQMLLDRTL
jgi:flagellin-like protein